MPDQSIVSAQHTAETLVQALPHMLRYDDAIVVVKYGGHAMSENGEVRPVGFAELDARGHDSIVGANGDGPNIVLRTSFRNITIQASGARQTQASARVN